MSRYITKQRLNDFAEAVLEQALDLYFKDLAYMKRGQPVIGVNSDQELIVEQCGEQIILTEKQARQLVRDIQKHFPEKKKGK